MDRISPADKEMISFIAPDAAWVLAYRKYIRFWINLARTASLSEDDAKDVVHGVIASILAGKSKRFESMEHVRNYVAKAVLNRSIQAKARNDRRITWDETMEVRFPTGWGGDETEQRSQREAFMEAMKRLSENDFEIIKLRFFSGLTFAQISKILGVPISTLKSREDAALRRLRKLLRKKGFSNV
jgi:RNA polymerase sigma-70 factor (ECF subfamily)